METLKCLIQKNECFSRLRYGKSVSYSWNQSVPTWTKELKYVKIKQKDILLLLNITSKCNSLMNCDCQFSQNNSKIASLTYLMDQNSCVGTLWFGEFETLLPLRRGEKHSFFIKHFNVLSFLWKYFKLTTIAAISGRIWGIQRYVELTVFCLKLKPELGLI